MTDHDTHEVSGCCECFFYDMEYGEQCRHPVVNDGLHRVNDPDATPPGWCPLRVRPVLVRLAAKESK